MHWNQRGKSTPDLYPVLSITLLSIHCTVVIFSCFVLFCSLYLIFFSSSWFSFVVVVIVIIISPLLLYIPFLSYKKSNPFSPLSFCFLFGKKMGVVRIELTTSWLWDTRSTDWATLPSVHRTSVFYITKFNPWALYFYCRQSIHVNLLWWSLFDLLTYVHCWKHKLVCLK